MFKAPTTSIKTGDIENLSDPRKVMERKLDISRLEEIFSLISVIIDSCEGVFSLLARVGRLAKNISFNDDDSQYIRNKYCSIDRSNNAKKREGGLELVNLEVLAHFSDEGLSFQEGEVLALLVDSGELLRLKDKISLIIEAETRQDGRNDQDILAELKEIGVLKNFKEFSSKFYIEKICHRFLELLNDEFLATLDFSQKKDRYYFGNCLLKIGELSKELIDFVGDDAISGVFKVFKKIRNSRIAHFPKLMVQGSDAETGSSEIIRSELFPIAKVRLREILVRGNLNNFTSLASGISKLLFTDNFVKIDKEMLDSLRNENVVLSNEEKDKKVAKDPKKAKDITLSNIEGLLRGISKQIEFLKPGKGLNRGLKKVNADITKYNKVIIDNVSEGEPLELLGSLFDEEGFKNYQGLVHEKISSLGKRTFDEDVEILEEEIDESEVLVAQENDLEKLRNNLVTKLNFLTKELSYLKEIKDEKFLKEEIKVNIMQFSLVKIIDVLKNVKIDQIENFSTSMTHATVFQKSVSRSVAVRNKGVAHDIFSFNQDEFLKVIQRSTATFETDIKALANIIGFNYEISKDGIENNVDIAQFSFAIMLNNVGLCHLRLGNDYQAKKMMLESLEYYKGANLIKNIPEMPGLVIDDISVILEYYKHDSDLIRFNRDLKERKTSILMNLFGIYWSEGDIDNAFETVNKIADLENEEKAKISTTTLINQGVCLMKLGRVLESKKKFDTAFKSTADPSAKVALIINEIILFKKAKEYEICRNKVAQIEYLLESEEIKNPEDILQSFIHLGAYYIDDIDNLDHASQLFREATEFLDEKRGEIFDSMGNAILSFEASILTLKISILVRQVSFSSLSKNFNPVLNVLNCSVLEQKDADDMESQFQEWLDFKELSKNSVYKVSQGAILDLSAAFSNASKILNNSEDFITDPSKALDYSNKALELQGSCNSYSSATLFNRATMHHILGLAKVDSQENLEEAIKYFKKTLDNGGIDDETKVLTHKIIGQISNEIGLDNDAIKHYRSAFHILTDLEQPREVIEELLCASIKKEMSARYSKTKSEENCEIGL